MPTIVQSTLQSYIDAARNGTTTTERGCALEDLICYLFRQVPGISIRRRDQKNVFLTEEIDIALWNDGPPDGFFFLPNIILVECKNWCGRVGSSELSWFDTKLRSRGLNFGIFVAPQGITGESQELTAAHSIVASALREGRRLVVVTTDDLLTITDSAKLVLLLKEKLCDLAVMGTLG